MASTILDQANLAAAAGDDVRSGIIESFASGSPLLRVMPVVSIMGNSYTWRREAALPATGFRAVNEALTESTGKVEKRSTDLKILGVDLDVDNFIVETGGAEQRTIHEMMAAKAMGQKVGISLLQGALVTANGLTGDAESIDGLVALYGGLTSVSTAGENSGQIIQNAGASQALSLYSLDQAIQAVENPTHIVAPKKLKLRLKAYLRSLNALSYTEDEAGRPIEVYNNLPILEADELGNQAGIAFNENGNTTASIYVIRAAEDGLVLLQSPAGIRVKDLGEQNSKPVWRTRMEWYFAMADLHKRCVARLYNIADIAAVA